MDLSPLYFEGLAWDLLAMKGITAEEVFYRCKKSSINVYYHDTILVYVNNLFDIFGLNALRAIHEENKDKINDTLTNNLRRDFFKLVDEYLEEQKQNKKSRIKWLKK